MLARCGVFTHAETDTETQELQTCTFLPFQPSPPLCCHLWKQVPGLSVALTQRLEKEVVPLPHPVVRKEMLLE